METPEARNVLGNRKLSGHVADAAWGGLARRLECKAERSGKRLAKIDRRVASGRTCPGCGSKAEELPLPVRRRTCRACGREHDRDIDAARNIRRQGILKPKAEGLSVPACGGFPKSP